MKILHNNVIRKFIDVISLKNWQVKSKNVESGDVVWNDIDSINKTIEYEIYQVKLDNGATLKCADNHILVCRDESEVFAKDCDGKAVKTEGGFGQVTGVVKTGRAVNMYDLSLSDSTNHLFLTNGILSHNSTAYNIFVLWYCMFHSTKAVMMCAQREATAVELLGRIRMAYEYIPEWIKPSVTEYNKKSIEFGNMSVIKAFATRGGGARGFTANVLVVDEAAFLPPNEASEFFASVYPVISSGKNSKVIMVSTPNGAQGLYYDIWTQANLNAMDPEKNPEGWKPVRIDWFEVPGRDEKWKKQQIASVGIERWEQEFECQFTSSSFQKLIPSELTDRYRKSYNKLIES